MLGVLFDSLGVFEVPALLAISFSSPASANRCGTPPLKASQALSHSLVFGLSLTSLLLEQLPQFLACRDLLFIDRRVSDVVWRKKLMRSFFRAGFNDDRRRSLLTLLLFLLLLRPLTSHLRILSLFLREWSAEKKDSLSHLRLLKTKISSGKATRSELRRWWGLCSRQGSCHLRTSWAQISEI